MEKIEYSFADEVASKFCYDMDNKKIEIHFTGYLDLINKKHVENLCVLIIDNWKNAKCKVDGEKKFDKLDKHIGIISMILSLEKQNDELVLYVNTIDNRYLTLIFIESKLYLNVANDLKS
ncbi:MAG: hypothetical protein ABIP51_03745 [Bacteroidia bacterium]